MAPHQSARSASGRLFAVAALLAVAGTFACGSENPASTGGSSDVASVVVTGASQTVMLVSDSVHLVATPVNATGAVVASQRVTWRSSAPSVAAVRDNGVVVALSAGTTVITASAGGHEGSATLDIADGATIGTAGGVLTAAGGAITLSLAGGSVPQATLLLVRPAKNAPADVRLVGNTAYELSPDGVVFSRAPTLAVRYDPSKLPSGLVQASLQLYSQSGTSWAVISGSKVDTVAHTVSGLIARSGIYAVRSTPVDHIVLTGAVVNGALYVGQATKIQAGLVGSAGEALPDRSLQWTSSNPAVISVDATGAMTARSTGTATVTVSTDGKSASTDVVALAHPVADWSGATDWVSYQGDSRHSGFVHATVDPSVFRERWAVTPYASTAYYQPTAVGDRVYLATNGYFSAQRVVALNVADGSTSWTRDFGPIFGINQPTYDNGKLYLTSGGHEDTYMWAISGADGSLVFQTPFGSQWEHWKAPVIAGSTIVTAGGYYGGMYGFDRMTGKQTFFMAGPQVDGWGPVNTGGVIYNTGYVSGGGVRAVDPTTGKVLADIVDGRLTAVTTPVVGDAGELLTITGGRLMSVDLAGKRVQWDQSGAFSGMPVVGGGVVYGISGTVIAARRESDGSLLWSWTPPSGYANMLSLALTDNVLFVGTSSSSYGGATTTFAIDLASHRSMWSYPMGGDMALSSQGVLYIVQAAKIAAISIR